MNNGEISYKAETNKYFKTHVHSIYLFLIKLEAWDKKNIPRLEKISNISSYYHLAQYPMIWNLVWYYLLWMISTKLKVEPKSCHKHDTLVPKNIPSSLPTLTEEATATICVSDTLFKWSRSVLSFPIIHRITF